MRTRQGGGRNGKDTEGVAFLWEGDDDDREVLIVSVPV